MSPLLRVGKHKYGFHLWRSLRICTCMDPCPVGPFRPHRNRKENTMSKFYNVTTPVTGNDGKTRFMRVGVAFPQDEGAKSVMKIQLDAFPANGELVLFAPRTGDNDEGDVTE